LRLALAFRSGYTALDLLDASVAGYRVSTARILELVERMPDSLKQAPQAPQKHNPPKVKNEKHYPTAEEFKFENIFPRPEGTVKGPRKVPFLVHATGLPFVRWKKPQPENVTRLLQTKIVKRQRRLDDLDAIENQLGPMATLEDNWDSLVKRLKKEESGKNQNTCVLEVDDQWSGSFKQDIFEYEGQLRRMFHETDSRSIQLAKRFTAIVLKERELAEKERKERKAVAKAKWLERCINEPAAP